MPRARKPTAGEQSTSKQTKTRSRAVARTPPRKSAKATQSASVPMIDTAQAAQAAAKMLIAGVSAKPPPDSLPRQESSLFKQLKASLNKPHALAMSNLLDKSEGPGPAKLHPLLKQVGHDQTLGQDVTRSGVPRRTPG